MATPPVPSKPSVFYAGNGIVSLAWSATKTSDKSYVVFRDGVLLMRTDKLFYQDSGVTEGSTYSYTVAAEDTPGGNMSAQSVASSITLPLPMGFTLNLGPGVSIYLGRVGSPNGIVDASVGSLWLRKDGGAGTTLYVKESAGVNGWTAK